MLFKRYFIKELLSIIILLNCSPCGAAVSNTQIFSQNTTALSLLDKYAENQNNLLSFIMKYEETMEQDLLNRIGQSSDINGKYKQYETGECRFNGNRFNIRRIRWGNIERSAQVYIPKENAKYFSELYDGKIRIQSNTALINGIKKHPSQIYPKPSSNLGWQLVRFYHSGLFMGYMEQGDCTERIDAILRNAKSLTVRKKPELVNDSFCSVIEGITSKGKYTVWLDPDHGYNLTKVIVERKPGDFYISKTTPLPTGTKVDYSIEDIRFKQIQGIWVPIELTAKYNQINPNGYRKYLLHIKRTTLTFDPDFSFRQSFVPDDIPDGSSLTVLSGSSTVPFSTDYTWKNGKPCDKNGNLLDF